jgi:hypothetical protein
MHRETLGTLAWAPQGAQPRQDPSSPVKRSVEGTCLILSGNPLVSSLFAFSRFRASTRGRFLLQFALIVINGRAHQIF